MYLLYWLFLWCSGEFWDKSLAEKLTQEQVLEELGVKIETKGKKEGQKNYIVCHFLVVFSDGLGNNKIRFQVSEKMDLWQGFSSFLANFFEYI